MEKINFEELVIQELKSLNKRFDGLEWRFDGLEWKMKKIENQVSKISLDLMDFRDEFRDFSWNQELEHQSTRKLINQAFESINENILYQAKVDRIEKILKWKPRVQS